MMAWRRGVVVSVGLDLSVHICFLKMMYVYMCLSSLDFCVET